jgi:Rho-binding antiterminator
MASDDYEPVDCNVFDYVEIACMYRYPVRIFFRDGRQLDGTAVDTAVEAGRGEFLVLDIDGKSERVRLDTIATLETRVAGARFSRVNITG